jgi:sugar O-acyltransferase (sialic acid O-acetyltransferase NeuD family)
MKSRKLLIFGSSAFADIAAEYFSVDTEYEPVAFTVERKFLKETTKAGLPFVAFEELQDYFDPKEHWVFVATVYTQLNRLRTRLAAEAKQKGYKLASYISPRSFVWRNVTFGEHCFVFEDNTLQPFVEVKSNVVLWSGNHIGHHSVVRDNCFVSSHVVVSGFCDIGENTFLGVNCTVANNVKIARDNWIGPGVVVSKDTSEGQLLRVEQPEPAKITAPRFFKVKQ